MPHVIFLNGPPRCGKDTAGEIIEKAVAGAQTFKLAHALKIGTHALFAGLRGTRAPQAAMNRGHNRADMYEHSKGLPSEFFYGKTPREAYIAVSELLCKPLLGQDFFGRLVAYAIGQEPHCPLWAITDSGFAHEAEPIIRAVGRENCTLVRVHRDGCTFAGDSRSYIDLDVPTKLDLNNNGTIAEFAYLIRTAVLGKIQ